MSTTFKQIIDKKINAYIIHEDENNLAFLDINPIQKGHTLVIPKIEVDNIFNLPEDNYKKLFFFSKNISNSIQKTFNCLKVGMAVIGLDILHAHIHLLPINKIHDFDFQKKKIEVTNKEMIEICNRIKQNL